MRATLIDYAFFATTYEYAAATYDGALRLRYDIAAEHHMRRYA